MGITRAPTGAGRGPATALLLLALLLIAGFAPLPEGDRRDVDAVALGYVRLTLAIGEHEPGYVDAYFGSPALADEVKRSRRTLRELSQDARQLAERVKQLSTAETSVLGRRRLAFLRAQLRAAEARLQMLQGRRFSFEDEAEGLFGVRPALKPLSAYDPVLARVQALLPGDGPLADRVDNYLSRFEIPRKRLKQVMHAAMAECRRRTLAHIRLPAQESFELRFVTGKPWSGYNYYLGGARSRIEINTDLPVRISRAVDLGCHEGYPGHHVLNVLLETRLARERGWQEFTVYPLYSPESLIAEGTANYGIELAFPGNDRLQFEQQVLYLRPVSTRGRQSRCWNLAKQARSLQLRGSPSRATIWTAGSPASRQSRQASATSCCRARGPSR
jgi:hypothetical protein